MNTYSDPVNELSKGFVRWYSSMCAVVAFEREHLSDQNIGCYFETDVTMNVNGKVTMDINNECDPSEMSRMFTLVDEVTQIMQASNVVTLVEQTRGVRPHA